MEVDYSPTGLVRDIVNHQRKPRMKQNTIPSWLEDYPKKLYPTDLDKEKINAGQFNPLGLIQDKSTVGVNDKLFNEKKFCKFWKKRSKEDDVQYELGKQDLDNDKIPDNIAYRRSKDGQYVLYGFNNYYNSGPQSSKDYWKRNYYQLPRREREKISFSDYFTEHYTDEGTEKWLNDTKRKKIEKAINKSMVNKVKAYFDECDNFKALTPVQKNQVAKRFIQLIFNCMYEGDLTGPQKKFLKSTRFMLKRDECINHIITQNLLDKAHKEALVVHLLYDSITNEIYNYIYNLIPPAYQLSEEDIVYIVKEGMDKRVARKNKRRVKKGKKEIELDSYIQRYYYPTKDIEEEPNWDYENQMSETEEEENQK